MNALSEISQRTSSTNTLHGNKTEVRMGRATVPKKGLISLSTTDDQEVRPVPLGKSDFVVMNSSTTINRDYL